MSVCAWLQKRHRAMQNSLSQPSRSESASPGFEVAKLPIPYPPVQMFRRQRKLISERVVRVSIVNPRILTVSYFGILSRLTAAQ